MGSDGTITTRDRLAAAALVAAPVVLGVGLVIHPKEVGGEADQLEIIGQHVSRWGAAHLLIYIGSALMVGAIIGLVRLADRHHGKGGLVAGIVAGAGAVALAATATTEMVTRHVVEAITDPTTQRVVYHSYEKAGDLNGAVLFPCFLLSIGLLGMMVVLLRARAVAPWAAVAIGVGSLLAPIPAIAIRDIGAVVMTAGMVTAAGALVRTSARAPFVRTALATP